MAAFEVFRPEPAFTVPDRHGSTSPERRAGQQHDVKTHFQHLYEKVPLDPGVSREQISTLAIERSTASIQRENAVAAVVGSREFTIEGNHQKDMRGPVSIGIAHCPDGGIPTIHLAGHMAGSLETLAGIPPLTTSNLTGEKILASPWFNTVLTQRPQKDNDQLLEWLIAHSHCGRMGQIEQEAKAAGKPFGDQIDENLQLFLPIMEVIDTTYNDARIAQGKKPLNKVAIRAVYAKEDMGFTVGYGTRNAISSTDLLQSGLADEIVRDNAVYRNPYLEKPGAFNEAFMELDTQIAREHLKTHIMRGLTRKLERREGLFAEAMHAAYGIDELKGLTKEQQRAFSVFFARQIARNFLGGQYLGPKNGNHHHAGHHEQHIAISLEGSHTVGRDDPEVQAFGSSPTDVPDAARHIVTKATIMQGIEGGITHPYPLFISTTVPETAQPNGRAVKAALERLQRDFTNITNHPEVAALIRAGKVAPIGVVNSNESHMIKKVATNLVF